MRKIKFRAWDNKYKKMYFGDIKIVLTYPLDEVAIMQFTGLYDLHGIEIYEGDIVRYTKYREHKTQKYSNEIVFDLGKGAWAAEYMDGEYHYFGNDINQDACEVIGNIYETAEILRNPDFSKISLKIKT